jgi:hypothetical protein
MTDAVIAAIGAKWRNEIGPKPKPLKGWAMTTVKQHTTLSVTISKGRLEDWKEFLSDLLTKPESWVRTAPEVQDQVKARAMREQIREEKREAELQRQLGVQMIDTGFKALATKLHPDHNGGSTEAMARLNQVRATWTKAFIAPIGTR